MRTSTPLALLLTILPSWANAGAPRGRLDATATTTERAAEVLATTVIENEEEARELAWLRSLQGGGYALPTDVAPSQVLARVRKVLGSRDSALRDEVTYDLMRRWLFPMSRFEDGVLREHATALMGQLAVPTDAQTKENDAVLLRSFSALHLSLLAARDVQHSFLEDAGWRALLDAAFAYLAAERDVRGWVDGTGWHHSVAHTADLLKFLARSPRFGPKDQARLFAAFEEKLTRTPVVLVWGEDERLAAAIASIIKRDDFELAPFEAWLGRERSRREAIRDAQPFDAKGYVVAQNARNVLASLYVALCSLERTTPEIDAAKGTLIAALRG